ncbi:hypothetical protein OIU79_007723 [Salix purpurea]|uniref:Uncharacterized protein n=1 Tax=Salix purpurea TaxID=77065 RepID=A0A9Q0TGM8_SALPP|nr:hypothetical protein OIU79_007723 [Salix purpurea]
MDIKFHYRTVEDDIIMDQVDSPEIVDDLELGQDEAVDIKDKEVNKQKTEEAYRSIQELDESPIASFFCAHCLQIHAYDLARANVEIDNKGNTWLFKLVGH